MIIIDPGNSFKRIIQLGQIFFAIGDIDQMVLRAPFWAMQTFYKCLYNLIWSEPDTNHLLIIDHQIIQCNIFNRTHYPILQHFKNIISILVV